MKQVILGLLFCGAAFFCGAQQVVDITNNDVDVNRFVHTVGGEPVGNVKFVKLVEGSPFFKDDWLKADIVLQSGAGFKNIASKLDLMENKIHYLDPKGNELIATQLVKEITFYDPAHGASFRFVNADNVASTAKSGWYLLLFSGKASLYQVFDKQVFEDKPYGTATTEQRIKTKNTYLVVHNNVQLSVKKLKELPEILNNKKSELEAFIKNQNKNFSEQDRIIDAITYYNSLL